MSADVTAVSAFKYFIAPNVAYPVSFITVPLTTPITIASLIGCTSNGGSIICPKMFHKVRSFDTYILLSLPMYAPFSPGIKLAVKDIVLFDIVTLAILLLTSHAIEDLT